MTDAFADAPVEYERKSDIQLKVTTYGGNPQGGRMTTKEVVAFLARISADLTLAMGRPHDEDRLERLITDIRANIDRINREGITK